MEFSRPYSGGVVTVPARKNCGIKNAMFICPVCGLPRKYTEGIIDWRGQFVCNKCDDEPPAFARRKHTYIDSIALEHPSPQRSYDGVEQCSINKGLQNNFELGRFSFTYTFILDGVSMTFNAGDFDFIFDQDMLQYFYRVTDAGDRRITDAGEVRLATDTDARFQVGTFTTRTE